MIDYNSIKQFFDLEAEASKERWEQLMKLPLKERVRKRKAIQNVQLDPDFDEQDGEHNYLLRVSAKQNLSDFREGDFLRLHKDDSLEGIKCWIQEFQGEDDIILGVYRNNVITKSTRESLCQCSLGLDKDYVDLRMNVFCNFLCDLSHDSGYWAGHIVNKRPTPTFDDFESYIDNINGTAKELGLDFTEKQKEAILNSLSCKDYYLIQGPPGTGKSHVLAWIVLEEMFDYGHKVIIIGPNHLTVNNMLIKICDSYPAHGYTLKVGQSYHAPRKTFTVNGVEKPILNIEHLNVSALNAIKGAWVAGMTSHCLYTSRAEGLTCDTLVVDEAGQMTIPLALMGMIKAKKVILAGDHKQLPPIVTSEDVPDNLKQSIFQRLITEENCTMLDVSFRMRGPICKFVSDVFYEGKVRAKNEACGDGVLCDDALYSFDSPVVIHNVDDEGVQTSDKEAEFIVDVVLNYLHKGLSAKDIAVLSPFRAQAANIRRRIRKCEVIAEEDRNLIAVDTIDKMQGQEREVIIVTLVAGNLEYMTEMMDFLYSPNKLNVAFSRAKSKLIIVGNINNIRKLNLESIPHMSRIIDSEVVKYV